MKSPRCSVIGGNFASVNDQPRNRIARLHADGTVESTDTFNPGTGATVDFCM
ncbi:MAG: delta-60 repeat domain-containing protein [Verrucomicrobiales bacterium]